MVQVRPINTSHTIIQRQPLMVQVSTSTTVSINGVHLYGGNHQYCRYAPPCTAVTIDGAGAHLYSGNHTDSAGTHLYSGNH